MNPKILKTEEEYEAALEHVSGLMDASPGSSEEDELELWSLLVEQYEEQQYPIDLPDPIEAIKFRMEQMGLQQKDLTRYIPAKSKVSEILSHKRPLSLSMIRALHDNLGISAEVLVREVKLTKPGRATANKGKGSSQKVARRKSASKAAGKKKAEHAFNDN